MSYEVSTSVFEGPFDLLLHLILKQEVDLWEISLSRIVDEYLAELERMENLDLDVTTEFLLIARSEEHTSELQSLRHLVCRLLFEKKKIERRLILVCREYCMSCMEESLVCGCG